MSAAKHTERILLGLGVWVVALLITIAIGSLSVCEQDETECPKWSAS